VLLREERQRQYLDSRLTAKQGTVAGLGGGRAIAWKATVASVDGTGGGAVLVLVRVLVPVDLLEDQRHQGLESRLTTKRLGGTVVVVVVGRAIAWKTTNASWNVTFGAVDGFVGVFVESLAVLRPVDLLLE